MDPERHDHDRPRGHPDTPTLLRLLAAGQLDVASLVTHRFRMDDFLDAYEVFADPARTGALKVLVTAE